MNVHVKQANTVAEAAEILNAHAEEVRVGSTYQGNWGGEHEAKTYYERISRVVRELRALELGASGCLFPYVFAAGVVAGYIVCKWLG